MIKVMLKQPVTSGYDQSKQLVDKLGLFLLVEGVLDETFIQRIGEAGTKWFKGVSPSRNRVVIPIDNIAYLEEVSGDVAG